MNTPDAPPCPMKTWAYDHWSLPDLIRTYPGLMDQVMSEFPNLPASQWGKIASLILGTCHSCHEAGSACQCWNDE